MKLGALPRVYHRGQPDPSVGSSGTAPFQGVGEIAPICRRPLCIVDAPETPENTKQTNFSLLMQLQYISQLSGKKYDDGGRSPRPFLRLRPCMKY